MIILNLLEKKIESKAKWLNNIEWFDGFIAISCARFLRKLGEPAIDHARDDYLRQDDALNRCVLSRNVPLIVILFFSRTCFNYETVTILTRMYIYKLSVLLILTSSIS